VFGGDARTAVAEVDDEDEDEDEDEEAITSELSLGHPLQTQTIRALLLSSTAGCIPM
jgi:hypothetical protein